MALVVSDQVERSMDECRKLFKVMLNASDDGICEEMFKRYVNVLIKTERYSEAAEVAHMMFLDTKKNFRDFSEVMFQKYFFLSVLLKKNVPLDDITIGTCAVGRSVLRLRDAIEKDDAQAAQNEMVEFLHNSMSE